MKNIVLIGMPSSGKSTVGRALAKRMEMAFLDTDLLIRRRENKSPKDIVNSDGLESFLKIQESVVLEINASSSVVSTGGSVACSEISMNHLKKNAITVFLNTDFNELEGRISVGRRFARNSNQSLRDIYEERMPFYKKYADLVIDCTNKKVDDIVAEIERAWGGFNC